MTGYDPTKPYKAQLKELIQQTWGENPYVEVRDGYYASMTRKHRGIEIDHTDGLGTKGLLHWEHRTFQAAAQDALAMNVNDLALAGAVAYKAQAHLMIPKDDHKAVVEIMEELVKLCKIRKIAITGGETSIHNNLKGMELSLTVSGVVVDEGRTGKAKPGDRLVCLRSSGPHSNGFTLIRQLFGDEFRPWMVEPTRLYDVVTVGRKLPIHAAMHITGGAFTKLHEIIPDGCAAVFDEWEIPGCFTEIYGRLTKEWEAGKYRGNPHVDLFRAFNMGIGMVLAVPAEDAAWVATTTGGFVGGEIVKASPGHKITISTTFTESSVEL